LDVHGKPVLASKKYFFGLYSTGLPSKALRSELFSVKALSARLWKLTELTKRLIAIIIVSFTPPGFLFLTNLRKT
jgi:hypothetical protein